MNRLRGGAAEGDTEDRPAAIRGAPLIRDSPRPAIKEEPRLTSFEIFVLAPAQAGAFSFMRVLLR